MLQSMRNKIKGFVAFFLVALLTIPLALVGVDSLFLSSNSVGEVADVDGNIISERDLQLAIGRERQRMTDRWGAQLPPEFFSDENLRAPVLENLVKRALVANFTDTSGMVLTDADVDKTIVKLPEFQIDGKFDTQRFIQVIRAVGYTPASFRQQLKEDLLVHQMQTALISSDFITDNELFRAVALSKQTRDFSWLTLPLAGIPEVMTVTDEEVSAYYEENKQDYLSEEQVAVEYIDINVTDLMSGITVDEEDIRQQYEQMLTDHVAPITREAAHIMIKGDDAAAEKKIADITERLSANEDFAALASQFSDDFGSRDNGGNLGTSSGDAFPEEFEKVLLELEEGQVSDPVTIDDATHFIKLVAVTKTKAPVFEEQREGIVMDLKRLQAEEQFVQEVQVLEDAAYNADSLEEVGNEFGFHVGKTALFSRLEAEAKDDIAKDSRVVAASFSEQVVEKRHSSDIIEMSADRVVVVKLIDHKPVRTLTLDEKREAITTTLKQKKAMAQLAEQAMPIRQSLDEGTDIDVVGKENGLTVSSKTAAQRNEVGVPPELLESIFDAAIPKAGNASIIERHLDNGDYVIASLSNVVKGRADSLSTVEYTNFRKKMSSDIVENEYSAWQSQLRKNAEVAIYRLSPPTL